MTTARFTPRVRRAGTAKMRPTGIVSRIPRMIASSTATPACTNRPAMSAPMPANAHWASEICPA